jgi:hypothetical protein
MPGPLPKPDAVNRAQKAFTWTDLPRDGRKGAPPKLPALRKWSPATRKAWAEWWATPQATVWDQSGKSLHRWAFLFDTLATNPDAPVAIHAAMTAIEDRHGFTPQAMARLRWRVIDEGQAVTSAPPARRRLKVV